MKKNETIDAYIATFPTDVQTLLQQFRAAVKEVAPMAEETISYSIPAFKWNGMLVWFAAHTRHIGFYPRGSGIEKFQKQLSGYKSAKGSVQFPFDQPLPLDLVKEIVKFRLSENQQRVEAKKKK